MLRSRSSLGGPFGFLFARSAVEDRLAAYILREHRRGRSLTEILDDPYVQKRTTEHQRKRVLEREDVIHAFGAHVVAEHRDAL